MEKGLVDTAVYILRDDRDDDDNLITFTEQRDSKGVSCVSVNPYVIVINAELSWVGGVGVSGGVGWGLGGVSVRGIPGTEGRGNCT